MENDGLIHIHPQLLRAMSKEITDLSKQNADLQHKNTELLLAIRELKAQILGHEAIVAALHKVPEGSAVSSVRFDLPSSGEPQTAAT